MSDVTSATTTPTPGAGKSGDGYHHGDLPNALRRAAVEVIEERGAGGFSLREVARRAGVSHTAPAHHFGDMKGLLTSVAEEGFAALHAASEAAVSTSDDPVEQLTALGRAYVCGLEAYGVLHRVVADMVADEGLAADADEVTWLCWSTMQGLVQLAPKIALIAQLRGGEAPEVDELIARFTTLMVDGIRNAT
jgi:AcrR family transcriptional regulator